ncbi:hypothetical protein BP6252_07122 [Coleophoma cylindrospora]|uniref:Allergen Asp f 4 n=1 Tax=Coleophoma cylindrospora TaxID=1849047 RepID=A0A3D8RGN2_9HELO|nr:hypothetical protein BP6252_07122 [Coleophoma cylindrospora]
MRYSIASAALLSAITIGEVMAGPTNLAHRHLHNKKDVVDVVKREDWVVAVIDGATVSWINNYFGPSSSTTATTSTSTAAAHVAAAAATTTSAAAAASTSTSALSDALAGIDSTITALWKDLVGISNDLTKFGASSTTSGSTGDNYYGNCGSPYGSNIIKVASRGTNTYTIDYINTSDEDMTVVIWNKIGPDMQVLSGSALAPTRPTLTFALSPGSSQMVAFAEDSQIAFAQACDTLAASGAFATTWGECNFVKSGTGYDVSAIMNAAGNTYNMTITSVEAPSCTSSMTENMWLTATDPVGTSDGSCYIAQSTAQLTVQMGGTVA